MSKIPRFAPCLLAFFSLSLPALGICGPDEERYESLSEQPGKIPILQLTTSCRACHGHEGKTPMFPGIPTIGFQDKAYLLMSLRAFKYGERAPKMENSPLGTEMIMVAAMLSDEDIERVADYFAVRPVWDMSQPVEYPASYVYPKVHGE